MSTKKIKKVKKVNLKPEPLSIEALAAIQKESQKELSKAKLLGEIGRLKRELRDNPTQPELQRWLSEAQDKYEKL